MSWGWALSKWVEEERLLTEQGGFTSVPDDARLLGRAGSACSERPRVG